MRKVSEGVTEPELNDAGRVCTEYPAEIGAVHGGGGIAKSHLIKRIEELGAELERVLFTQMEDLEDREIRIR